MTTTAITVSARALPTIEKARTLLAEARSPGEIRKIKAVAQAIATLERGKEIAIDAGEIILLADARIGELTAALPKAAPGGRGGGAKVSAGNNRKGEELDAGSPP